MEFIIPFTAPSIPIFICLSWVDIETDGKEEEEGWLSCAIIKNSVNRRGQFVWDGKKLMCYYYFFFKSSEGKHISADGTARIKNMLLHKISQVTGPRLPCQRNWIQFTIDISIPKSSASATRNVFFLEKKNWTHLSVFQEILNFKVEVFNF